MNEKNFPNDELGKELDKTIKASEKERDVFNVKLFGFLKLYF